MPGDAVGVLDFATAAPLDFLKAVDEGLRESVVLAAEGRINLGQGRLGEEDGQAGVALLEGRCWPDVHAVEAGVDSDDLQLDTLLLCALLEDAQGALVGLLGSKGGTSALRDAALVPGDLLDGVAESEDVVDAEDGDGSSNGGFDNIRSVIFAADTCLKDCAVDALAHKGVQGQESHVAGVDGAGAGDSEVGESGGCVGETVPDLPEVTDKEVLGYGAGVDADALANGDEVGGDEEACLAREGGWGSETVVVED